MYLYGLHGFVLQSPFVFSADELDPATAAAHSGQVVALELVDRVPEPATATLLLESQFADGTLARFSRCEDASHLLEFDGYRFHIAVGLHHVHIEVTATEDLFWLRVLTEGWLMAVLVQLRGDFVLHASSVLLGGVLVGFVGSAGMGKSTCAAQLCSIGAQLFGDDILAVETGGTKLTAYRGSPSLRLRSASDPVALAVEVESQMVGDRRTVRVSRAVPAESAVGVLLIPDVSTAARDLAVRWLSPTEAVTELRRHPRIFTWVDRASIAAEFSHLARIADLVKVGILHIPLGLVDPRQLASVVGTAVAGAA
jgi:hypothetical protein